MESLLPPKPFVAGANPAGAWKKWRARFMNYLLAANLSAAPEARLVAIFLHVIGEEGQDVADTFQYIAADGEEIAAEDLTLDIVLSHFDGYYLPRTNVTFERRMFLSHMQREGQSIDEYVTELRQLAKTCEYGAMVDEFIKDAFVGGVHDVQVKERLLRTDRLDLSRAIEIARSAEVSKRQIKSFIKEEPVLNVLQKQTASRNQARSRPKVFDKANNQSFQQGGPRDSVQCSNCGRHHKKGKCPAWGKTCHKCKKRNHFARKCRSTGEKNVNELSLPDATNTDDHCLFVGSLGLDLMSQSRPPDMRTVIKVAGKDVTFKLDTGAQANVMSHKMWKALQVGTLQATNTKLRTYTGQMIPLTGQSILSCRTDNREVKLLFLITQGDYDPILGMEACTHELGLLCQIRELQAQQPQEDLTWVQQQAAALIHEYADVFQGLGELPGEYHITLKEGVTPSVCPARKVPFALMDKLKAELNRMVALGVIRPVSEPTEWVHPMVLVHKPNGALRICLDPKELNQAIKRSHYKLPTFEEISSKMKGAKYFTVLDASQAFLQKKLDYESSLLCTFSTPFGRYCYTRLPYGISASPEVFQREMSEMLDPVDQAESYLDDIIQWGLDGKSYIANLRAVLEVARRRNLKLSKEKLQVAKTSVYYLGHEFSKAGIQASPKRVEAINDMPIPKDKKELQRWLGMVGYLTRFVPHLADKLVPLRKLLKKDTVWDWHTSHTQLVKEVQQSLLKTPVLCYYNVQEPCEVIVDASPFGLGAVLMQAERPVAYASCTLSETQTRYAHIEKELLAVTYGCEHFHQYVYGRNFVVYTDHKPLIAISRKPLNEMTSRIQRLFLRLQKYDVELRYRPGRDMHVSDALSRAPLLSDEYTTSDEDVYVQQLMKLSELDSVILKKLVDTTKTDLVLQALAEQVQQGWPRRRSNVQVTLRSYWPMRDEIHEHEGLLLRGDRIIVPECMRAEILARLHEGHSGIVNTLARARHAVYWPNMTAHVQDYVAVCDPCNKHQQKNRREPERPHDIPEQPWTKIAMDFFELQGKLFLQVIDYYSKYIETMLISNLTTATVVPAVKSIMARHGIPLEVITDGGPPFNSAAFQTFAQEWDFKHIRTSPKHPQANGEVERSIQTIKRSFRKVLTESEDPYAALLSWRNTPMSGNLYSPAQLLMGRLLRTRVPKIKIHRPVAVNHQTHQRAILEDQDKRRAATSHRRTLPPLEVGDTVWVRSEDKSWTPGTISEVEPTPRSYKVGTEGGGSIRRNRIQLRPRRLLGGTTDFRADGNYPQPSYTPGRSDTPQSSLSPMESQEKTSERRTIRPPVWWKDYNIEV